MPRMDKPIEPRGLTAQQRWIGEARDHVMRAWERTGDRSLQVAVGLFVDDGLTPEQTERMWEYHEKLHFEDALELMPEEMAKVKARLDS